MEKSGAKILNNLISGIFKIDSNQRQRVPIFTEYSDMGILYINLSVYNSPK